MNRNTVHVALLNAAGFSFTAVGDTRQEAMAAMKTGWNKHRQKNPTAMPFAEVKDSIWVLETPLGGCYRDDSLIVGGAS